MKLNLRRKQKSPVADGDLAGRREALARQLAELQWDLGGLAYEMAVRDAFRVELLVRQAARLQQVDRELAEVDRLLSAQKGGAAGSCPACGAPYPAGAAYCSQCGAGLAAKASPTPPAAAPPSSPPAPPSPPTSPPAQ